MELTLEILGSPQLELIFLGHHIRPIITFV